MQNCYHYISPQQHTAKNKVKVIQMNGQPLIKFYHQYDVYAIYYILYYFPQKMSTVSSFSTNEELRSTDKYRERAAQLFQKLQNLQETAENNKSQKQRSLIHEFNHTEKKVLEGSKIKEGWYNKVLDMVRGIQDELNDQKNQEEKCRRAVKTWVESTERELNQNFERLEKEKTKSEAALERFVENKVQSFILKNKGAWNQGTLINKAPYIEQIDFLAADYKKFLGDFQKECDKLKRETFTSVKECTRMVEEQLNNGEEDQVMTVMKAIHMDITSKLKSLKQQRERTEERVLCVLEKVIGSIGESKQ